MSGTGEIVREANPIVMLMGLSSPAVPPTGRPITARLNLPGARPAAPGLSDSDMAGLAAAANSALAAFIIG